MVIAQQIKQKEKSYLKNLHNQFNLLFFFFFDQWLAMCQHMKFQ